MTASDPHVEVAWQEVAAGADRRATAWRLLGRLLPRDAVLGNACPRCGAPHGPVAVTGAPFAASVSYAGGFAVVAAAARRDVSALGVDAEAVADGHRGEPGLAAVLGLSSATLTDWTRVEAVLKADGRGLRVDPGRVRVQASAHGWTARVPADDGLSRPVAYRGWEVAGPPGLAISVAVRPAQG